MFLDLERQILSSVERFDNFAFDEVVNEPGVELDQKTRVMCTLAVLLVYQAVDYLGIGRVFSYPHEVNTILAEKENGSGK